MIDATAKTDPRSRPLPDPARIRAAKIRLLDAKQSARGWARDNGESFAAVSKVLSGTRPCVRGAGRRIAIKLGIVDADHG